MFAIGNRALRKRQHWCSLVMRNVWYWQAWRRAAGGAVFCESSASEVESSLPEIHFWQRYFSPHFILILSEKQSPREAASSADSNVDGTIRDKLVNLDHQGIGLWLEYVGAIVWGEISSHGSWDYNQCMELWSLSTCSLGDHLTCWMITWNHKSPPGTTGNHLGPPSQLEGALGRWMWSSWAGGWWPVRTFNDADCALIELAQLVHTRNWWSYLGDPM